MAVNDQTLQQVEASRRAFTTLTDTHTRALVSQWVATWSELSADYEASIAELVASEHKGHVSQAKVRANKRLRDALEITRGKLDELAEQANLTITADLPDAVDIGGSTTAAAIASQMPPQATLGIAWDRVSPEALAAIVERSTQRIHAATQPIPADVERLMKRELIRGVAIGNNPRETARRILRRTEETFNIGTTRALRIARTETLDAGRAGSLVAAQQNADILKGWRWACDLSARTCPACLAMNGTMHDVDEGGPEGHPNCRCARVDITKSWADLGFSNVDEPEDEFPDAREWFDNLMPDSQKAIMGPERLKLLNNGDIKWGDLATKHENPDWRPSWQATPLKDLRKTA